MGGWAAAGRSGGPSSSRRGGGACCRYPSTTHSHPPSSPLHQPPPRPTTTTHLGLLHQLLAGLINGALARGVRVDAVVLARPQHRHARRELGALELLDHLGAAAGGAAGVGGLAALVGAVHRGAKCTSVHLAAPKRRQPSGGSAQQQRPPPAQSGCGCAWRRIFWGACAAAAPPRARRPPLEPGSRRLPAAAAGGHQGWPRCRSRPRRSSRRRLRRQCRPGQQPLRRLQRRAPQPDPPRCAASPAPAGAHAAFCRGLQSPARQDRRHPAPSPRTCQASAEHSSDSVLPEPARVQPRASRWVALMHRPGQAATLPRVPRRQHPPVGASSSALCPPSSAAMTLDMKDSCTP